MIRLYAYLRILFAAALLSACAANPRGAPFSLETASGDDLATVYVYRLRTPPILRTPYIEINRQAIASLPINSYAVVHLQPGTYDFTTSWGYMDRVMMNTGKRLSLTAKTTYYVEIAGELTDMGSYHTRLSVQAQSEPPPAIRGCSQVPARPFDAQAR